MPLARVGRSHFCAEQGGADFAARARLHLGQRASFRPGLTSPQSTHGRPRFTSSALHGRHLARPGGRLPRPRHINLPHTAQGTSGTLGTATPRQWSGPGITVLVALPGPLQFSEESITSNRNVAIGR